MNHPYANAAGYMYAQTTEWFDTRDDDESIWDASWSPVSRLPYPLESVLIDVHVMCGW